MLKVIINGCSGKMGRVLARCINEESDLELLCGVSPQNTEDFNFKSYSTMSEIYEKSDVVIDFSHHSTLDDVLSYTIKTKTPLVIATTGYNDEEMEKIHEAAKQIPVLLSFYMSLGVNILLKLVKEAAKN